MVKKKISVVDKIKEASKSVTTGIDEKDIEDWVTVYIMGKAYEVPADLTIMQSMEYAGYRFTRSCGCRAGFCGACSTIYRKRGEYQLQTAMACQTRVEDGMFLVMVPFAPAEKPSYDLEKEAPEVSVLLKYFPEIARCVSCNTCTKACPQDLEVMDYVQAALKGDFKAIADGSFDCIQCGLCALRCPAEIVQYHLAQLGRRVYGKYLNPREVNLEKRAGEIERGEFKKELDELLEASVKELETMYAERVREPDETEKFHADE